MMIFLTQAMFRGSIASVRLVLQWAPEFGDCIDGRRIGVSKTLMNPMPFGVPGRARSANLRVISTAL